MIQALKSAGVTAPSPFVSAMGSRAVKFVTQAWKSPGVSEPVQICGIRRFMTGAVQNAVGELPFVENIERAIEKIGIRRLLLRKEGSNLLLVVLRMLPFAGDHNEFDLMGRRYKIICQ